MMEEKFKEIKSPIKFNPKNEFKTYIIIAIILSISIVFLIGFVVGKLSANGRECELNPLTYGLGKFNEVNEEEYICNCYAMSGSGKNFNFDSEKVRVGESNYLFGEQDNSNEEENIDLSYLKDLMPNN